MIPTSTGPRRPRTRPVGPDEKESLYDRLEGEIAAVILEEADLLAALASVACLVHGALPHVYWTGFYRRVGARRLLIGPYQGTLGCLEIDFERGVCGACAREERTIVVEDVHAFPGHIACDPASRSEIVVPVFDRAGELIAVLDLDSDREGAFDEVDARRLERIVGLLTGKEPGPVVATRD